MHQKGERNLSNPNGNSENDRNLTNNSDRINFNCTSDDFFTRNDMNQIQRDNPFMQVLNSR